MSFARSRFLTVICCFAVLISGCSGGTGLNGSTPAVGTSGTQSSTKLAPSQASATQIVSLGLTAVDEASDSTRVEMDGIYPELRRFRTMQINVRWIASDLPTPYSLATKAVPSAQEVPGSPFTCGTPPYSGPTQFTGNTPPNCTPTGVFAGTYSNPDKAEVGTQLLALPANGVNVLPSGSGATAFGFAYIEAWNLNGQNTNNIEAGLAFEAGHSLPTGDYRPYLASYHFGETTAPYTVMTGTDAYLHVGSDSSADHSTTLGSPTGTCAAVGGCIHLTFIYINGTCPAGVKCQDDEWGAANGFTGNCCVYRRMTSIGSSMPYIFSGGYQFGPLQWNKPYTATKVTGGSLPDGCTVVITNPNQAPCATAYFDAPPDGGYQLYPQSSSYAQRSNKTVDGGETDTVFFPN